MIAVFPRAWHRSSSPRKLQLSRPAVASISPWVRGLSKECHFSKDLTQSQYLFESSTSVFKWPVSTSSWARGLSKERRFSKDLAKSQCLLRSSSSAEQWPAGILSWAWAQAETAGLAPDSKRTLVALGSKSKKPHKSIVVRLILLVLAPQAAPTRSSGCRTTRQERRQLT